MKKTLSIILSICMLLGITAGIDFSAHALSSSGSCGTNVTYTFNSSNGTLTISGKGEMSETSEFHDETSIKKVVINSGVKNVSIGAFRDCTGIQTVTLNNGLEKIEAQAFQGCSALSSVSFPGSLRFIGNHAFCNCTKLFNVSIPYGISEVGSDAFYDTGYYNTSSNWNNGILYNNCVLLNAKENYSGAFTVKEGIKVIANSAFFQCNNLTSVTIGNDVNSIGWYAFLRCPSLTSVTILDYVKTIGKEAFRGCSELSNLTIGNRVTEIESGAFRNCIKLTNIEIPNSVTSIGDEAFYACVSLTNMVVPNSVTSIDKNAFDRCEGLASIVINNENCEIYDSTYTINSTATIYGLNSDFNIVKAQISDSEISGLNTVYEYTKKAIVPSIKIKYNGITLKKDQDYTVSLINNVNQGTATIIINGIGNYTGSKKATFTIKCNHKATTDEAVPSTFTATGKTAGSHCSVCGAVIKAQQTTDKLASPKMNKVKKGKKSFTAMWSKSDGVDGYQVQYSLKKNFKGAKTKWAKKDSTKLKVKKLKSKKTYYVRVRAYKKINGKNVYSNWSTKKVKTK